MTCESVKARMQLAVDAALAEETGALQEDEWTRREQSAFHAHLAACPTCRRLYRDLLSLCRAMRHLPEREMPPLLTRRVIRTLQRRRRTKRLLRFGSAAAVVVICAGFLFSRGLRMGSAPKNSEADLYAYEAGGMAKTEETMELDGAETPMEAAMAEEPVAEEVAEEEAAEECAPAEVEPAEGEATAEEPAVDAEEENEPLLRNSIQYLTVTDLSAERLTALLRMGDLEQQIGSDFTVRFTQAQLTDFLYHVVCEGKVTQCVFADMPQDQDAAAELEALLLSDAKEDTQKDGNLRSRLAVLTARLCAGEAQTEWIVTLR